MKKAYWFGLSCLVFGITTWFYFVASSKHSIVDTIPTDAKAVVLINTPNFITSSAIEQFKGESSFKPFLEAFMPDSMANLPWKESGIDILSPVVACVFQENDSSEMLPTMVLALSDKDKATQFFKDHIQSAFGFEENTNNAESFYSSDKMISANFNKNTLILIRSKNDSLAEYYAEKINNTSKESSITKNKYFSELEAKDYDFCLFVKQNKLMKKSAPAIDCFTSGIDFKKGSIHISNKIIPFQDQQDSISSMFKNETSIINIDTSKALAYLSVNVNVLNLTSLLDQSIKDIMHLNGQLGATLTDINILEDEYITYDYDDNFNMVEIKKKKQQIVPDYYVFARLQENLTKDSTLNLLKTKGIKQKDSSDIIFQNALGRDVSLNIVDGGLSLYTNEEYRTQSASYKQSKPFELNINIKAINTVLDKKQARLTQEQSELLNKLKHFKSNIHLQEGAIIHETNIEFVNEKKNGLHSLMETILAISKKDLES